MDGDQPPSTAKKANWLPAIALALLGFFTFAMGPGFFILIAAVLVSPPVHRWLGERAARKGKVHGAKQAVILSLAVIAGPWIALLALGLALLPFADKIKSMAPPTVTAAAGKSTSTETAKPSPPAPAVQAPKVRSAWRYSESDDPMGERTKSACIESQDEVRQDFPYRNTTVTLCIRRTAPGGLDVFVRLDEGGQVLCASYGRCRLRVRFDEAAPQPWPGTEAADMSTDVFFLGREEKLVTALKTAKVFRLEMDIYQQGTQTVTFKTEALQWP